MSDYLPEPAAMVGYRTCEHGQYAPLLSCADCDDAQEEKVLVPLRAELARLRSAAKKAREDAYDRCIAVVESELEYPTDPTPEQLPMIEAWGKNPLTALRASVAVTKKSIADRLRADRAALNEALGPDGGGR